MFCINARLVDNAKVKCRFSGLGINAQKIVLRGYSVAFAKVSGSTPFIPHHLFIDIDEMSSNQIHNCLSEQDDGNFPHSNAIVLPVEDDMATIQFGMNIPFEINKRIQKEIEVHVKSFGAGHVLGDVPTGTPTATIATCKNVCLYFSYDWVANF